jgi:hypothetical protein
MHLCANGGKGLRACITASKAENLMASVDQFLYDGRTDKSGCARGENTHRNSPFR